MITWKCKRIALPTFVEWRFFNWGMITKKWRNLLQLYFAFIVVKCSCYSNLLQDRQSQRYISVRLYWSKVLYIMIAALPRYGRHHLPLLLLSGDKCGWVRCWQSGILQKLRPFILSILWSGTAFIIITNRSKWPTRWLITHANALAIYSASTIDTWS